MQRVIAAHGELDIRLQQASEREASLQLLQQETEEHNNFRQEQLDQRAREIEELFKQRDEIEIQKRA